MTHSRQGKLATAGLLLTAALILGACGSSQSGSSIASGAKSTGAVNTNGTITIGTTLAPTTLDPATGNSGADYPYLYDVFDRLIQFNPKTGDLEPMLATSWHFSGPSKLEFDVELRRGVTFSDGTPFNAQAVVAYSKEYIRDGDVVDDLQYVKDITAQGPFEVVYHLSQQNSQLPYGLADRAGMIPSPTAVAKEGKQFGIHPVGAGPYKFTSEDAGASYSFTRYNGYWNNAHDPRVENLTFNVFQSDSALVSAVRGGTINVASGVFPQDVATLKPDSSLDVSVGPNTYFDMVYFNGRLAPFNNPKLRLAFNLALNRTAIENAATDGLGTVKTEPSAVGTNGYVSSLAPIWTYNPAQAKSLVKQAGYPNGVNASCYTYPGFGWNITAPIVIAEEKAVGINLKVITGTPAQTVPFFTKNLSPCYLSAFGNSANPVTTYEALLWSKSYYNPGKTKFGVDQYIAKFFTTYTSADYDQLYYDINKVEKTAPGYAIVYGNPYVNVYQKNVAGWIVSPYDLDNFQGLYFKQ